MVKVLAQDEAGSVTRFVHDAQGFAALCLGGAEAVAMAVELVD